MIRDRSLWLKIPRATTNTICFHAAWGKLQYSGIMLAITGKQNTQLTHSFFFAPVYICKCFKITMPLLYVTDLTCSLPQAYEVLFHCTDEETTLREKSLFVIWSYSYLVTKRHWTLSPQIQGIS